MSRAALTHNRCMTQAKRARHAKRPSRAKHGAVLIGAGEVTGKRIADLGHGIVLVQTKGSLAKPPTRKSERTGVLISKLGEALSKPGLSRDSVFGRTAAPGVYSFYIDEKNPSRIARESRSGKVIYGRLVNGKFRAG